MTSQNNDKSRRSSIEESPRPVEKSSTRNGKLSKALRSSTQDAQQPPIPFPQRSVTYHQGCQPVSIQKFRSPQRRRTIDQEGGHDDHITQAPPLPRRDSAVEIVPRVIRQIEKEVPRRSSIGMDHNNSTLGSPSLGTMTENQLATASVVSRDERTSTLSRVSAPPYIITNSKAVTPTTMYSEQTTSSPRPNSTPNIVIFGESGTGKSSLINMLAEREVAGVSNSALGCTFGSLGYKVEINGTKYRLWDTAGLNEGDQGSVPAEQALYNLQTLIHNLRNGVSLLVYCIHGSRYRDVMKVNYDLFSKIICEGRVPIVIVITGLECESPMENWWKENRSEFEKYRMVFQGHACVTATKGKRTKSGAYMFEDEYAESREIVKKLIRDKCSRSPWVANGKDWMENIQRRISKYYEAYNSRSSRQVDGGNMAWGILSSLAKSISSALLPNRDHA